MANTSLKIANEIYQEVEPTRKPHNVVRKRIVGRTKTLGLVILVSLWRCSHLESTKLSLLIGSVGRLMGLSIASNGELILRGVNERESLKTDGENHRPQSPVRTSISMILSVDFGLDPHGGVKLPQ